MLKGFFFFFRKKKEGENLFSPVCGCWGFQASPEPGQGDKPPPPLTLQSSLMANPSVHEQKAAHGLFNAFSCFVFLPFFLTALQLERSTGEHEMPPPVTLSLPTSGERGIVFPWDESPAAPAYPAKGKPGRLQENGYYEVAQEPLEH